MHGFAVFGLYLRQEIFKDAQHIETARGEVAEYAVGAYEIVVEPLVGDGDFFCLPE